MVGQDAAPEISDLELLNELLLTHARRARYAHRALLSFYTSTCLFMLMVVLIGLTGLGLRAVDAALFAAFGGCVLFVVGVVLLVRETWLGIGALDRRFEKIMEVCRRLADRRS
jgi:hypothetical protein